MHSRVVKFLCELAGWRSGRQRAVATAHCIESAQQWLIKLNVVTVWDQLLKEAQVITRSPRSREKSRSWVTSAAALIASALAA
jgi:hypothetical protein